MLIDANSALFQNQRFKAIKLLQVSNGYKHLTRSVSTAISRETGFQLDIYLVNGMAARQIGVLFDQSVILKKNTVSQAGLQEQVDLLVPVSPGVSS